MQTALRNIPAHAGKTSSGASWLRKHKEHPRARGENGLWFFLVFWFRGTSPRTRGKLLKGIQRDTSLRNIPAHAGKTHSRNAPAGKL